ncbi:unnamed protein product [Candidula unifasciata]|uniref:Uncharacterized protein n=1 Tax=Candidula unifasciata TaxID=100452 RepID=A0A8S3YZS2_9EUPU|nr:unnamed protein product [Candidula unifasciata]
MAKQGNSEEWKKLAKFQEELAKQEENVESKIERLCMLEEEKEQFEEEKGIFYREKECLREAERDLKRAKETFRQEKFKACQELEQDGESDIIKRKQMLKEEEERLHEQREHLRKLQEKFHQEKEAFSQRKSEDQAREILIVDQEALTREMINEKTAFLQQEHARLLREQEILERKNIDLHEEHEQLNKDLDEREAMHQKEKEVFQHEKETLEEQIAVFQEEQTVFQKEQKSFKERSVAFEQKQERLEKEEEIIAQNIILVQTQEERLQTEKEMLEKTIAAFQKEQEDFQTKVHIFEKNNGAFQEMQGRLHKELEIFEKERMTLQSEKEKFQKEKELEKKCILFQEDQRRLQIEKSALEDAVSGLQEQHSRCQEDMNIFQDDKLRQEKHERHSHDKESQGTEQTATDPQTSAATDPDLSAATDPDLSAATDPQMSAVTDPQMSAEELMLVLERVEDDLDDAYEKIDRLENLITRGKAVLAEKTEAAKEANDKVKDLEEAVDALKSNVETLNAHLEAKSDECEKLKKMQDSYRTTLRELEGLKKELEATRIGRKKDRECYQETIRDFKLKLRDKQNADTSFVDQRIPQREYAPSVDQLRTIIMFENASKFLELKNLRQEVQEQKGKISDLEKDASQLQAEIKKVQLLLENESIKSEVMKSTANQAILARHKVEEELGQLRKQLGKGSKNCLEETPDEIKKLPEKDQLIDQLSKSLDRRNIRLNAMVLKIEQFIEENHGLQKLVAQHQQQVADLLKENSELKASVERLETHQQTVKQQQSQTSNVSTQTESNHLTQQPQATPAVSAPNYIPGGVVESFVIAVKDREILDFKRKLEKQTAKITDLEKDKSQLQTELQKLQLIFDSKTRKSTASQTVLDKRRDDEELVMQNIQPRKEARQSTEVTPVEVTDMLRNQQEGKPQSFDQLMESVHGRYRNVEKPRRSLQTISVAEPQNESTSFSRWNAIQENEKKLKDKQAQTGNLSENSQLKKSDENTNPTSQM